MKKTLFRASVIAFVLGLPVLSTLADKYVIYPIPRSVTMNSGALTMTEKVNVVCESTIDGITKNRLTNVFAAHGIETVFDGTDASYATVRLGTIGSGEQVETHSFDELGLDKTRVMVANKFDRHAISVSQHGITILGEHTNAVFYGIASLEQMLEQMNEGTLEYTIIYDRADQQNRGLVEGYYGYPYSVEVKKDLMRYMMRFKMNTYMYGAKSDPYHSQMWRDAYPTSISAEQEKNGWLTQDMVREISQVSEETKVNFIWAIHPGNEFLGSSTVISDIMSKFTMMHDLGVRHFGVFVDDVGIPSSDSDMKLNADRVTALQRAIENKWNKEGALAEDTVRPLHFVPQIYCNSFASSVDQRQRFMSALGKIPSYITVYSTGQGVWSVPNNSHTQTVVSEFGRAMGWWWNYPCNDNADGQIYPMDMYSNFVDMPSVGDGDRLPSNLNNCQGLVANPMQQGQVAKTSLFSIADYSWNNSGFNNQTSWEASFKTIIQDEQVRQAYHDISYYLRWNDPQRMETLINNYKRTLESGAPNSEALMQEILKIKEDCQLVMTLKDSEIQSDRLLYTDISPWLNTLNTYAIVVEKMLNVLNNPVDGHKDNWLAVKEVSDSLKSLDSNTLYTAYALEGMGSGISVSKRQAQLSRRYLYPFVYYLRDKAISPYFNDPTAITKPTVISNSPLLDAKVSVNGSTVSLTLPSSNLDVNKYVGVALPEPILFDKIVLDEALLDYARYSVDGKEWKKLTSADQVPEDYVGYFIFLNETGAGVRDFSINESTFSITLASQAKAVAVTLPEGGIYDNHTAELLVDGNYNTYTCLNRNQQNADKYELDLGNVVTLRDIRLCMGTVNGDHPNIARIQYSMDGSKWANLKIKGTDIYNWTIDLEQNVKYSNEMVYCDYDGAGNQARYVRMYVSKAKTGNWLRLYEIEVNRQYAENSTLAECRDGNGTAIEDLTDKAAHSGLAQGTTSPLTYSFNRHYDVESITFYSLPGGEAPVLSITADGTQWENLGTLTEPCQTIDLQKFPKAKQVRLEWQGTEAPKVYEIMPGYNTSSSSLPQEESELSKTFALLKMKSINALDSCGQGKALITKNNQFSSPYTESSEGSLNNLLDGKSTTFWHSAWSGDAVADGVHYLQVSVPEQAVGDVVMHFGRRSNTDGHHLIKARILGVTSLTDASAEVETVCDLDMPFNSQTETVVRTFNLPKYYPALRLLELKTTGGMDNVSSGFFHVGEFQLYSTEKHYIIKDAQTEADALLLATAPMPSEATEEDLNTLQAAYDAFMYKVFGIIPSGIDDLIGQGADGSAANVYYDLSGRVVTQPTKVGVYILNGKKVLVK